MNTENPKILYHSFNQDLNYFLIGTKEGCTIYKTYPLRTGFELSKKICISGEFSMVKMLNSSNIFIIVGSPNNRYLSNKEVLVWDNKNEIKIYKFLIKKEVLNLELTSDKIIVVCENIIYIFNTKTFQLIDIIKTGENLKGLIAVSYKERNILIYPSKDIEHGKLTIKNYDTQSYIYLNPDKGEISKISLSYNGLFLATVIKEGSRENKIIIFEAKTGRYLDEFTRYEEKGDNIKCISFNKDNNYISVSFTKGVIPLWSLKKAKELIGEPLDDIDKTTNIHGFAILSSNEQAFNHVQLKDYNNPDYEIVKLGDKNYLYIITKNGLYFAIKFEYSGKKKKKDGDFKVDDYSEIFKKK